MEFRVSRLFICLSFPFSKTNDRTLSAAFGRNQNGRPRPRPLPRRPGFEEEEEDEAEKLAEKKVFAGLLYRTHYPPRQPRHSPLYRTIERYLPEFERTYDQRYAKRDGPWRSIIAEAARRFLRCGDVHFGFARVRCPDCTHEMFVPFSCRLRSLCPSCHQKRTLLAAQTMAHTICAPVPHRQIVFTIPKRLRIYCRYDRSLLGKLARAAWLTVAEVYRQVLDRDDVTPGMLANIQTFGELIHFHPHIHAIATDGAFTPDGTFLCLPKIDTQRLLTVWQTKVFELFQAAGNIDQQTVDQMRSWPHSGFSVDHSVYLPAAARYCGPGAAGPIHPALALQPGPRRPLDR